MKCVCVIAALVCASADVSLQIEQKNATSEFGSFTEKPLRFGSSNISPTQAKAVTLFAAAEAVSKTAASPASKSVAKPLRKLPAKAADVPAGRLSVEPAAEPAANERGSSAKLSAPRTHSKEAIAAAGRHKFGAHAVGKAVLRSQESPKTHSAEAIVEAARHKAVSEEVPQSVQTAVRPLVHSSYSIASAAQHKKIMDKKRHAMAQADEMTRELSPGVAEALSRVLTPIEPSFVEMPTAHEDGHVAAEPEMEKERRAAVHKVAMKKARAAARQRRQEVRAVAAATEVKSAGALKKTNRSRPPAPSKKALAKAGHKHFGNHSHLRVINATLLKTAAAMK